MRGTPLFLLLLCLSASGTLFVDSNGTNNTSCGTEADPCRTLSQAVQRACVGLDDTIVVGPGLYDSPAQSINCSLTIRSTHGAGQTTLQESISQAGLYVNSVPNFTLDGFTIDMKSLAGSSNWLRLSELDSVEISNIQLGASTTSELYISQVQEVYLYNISWSGIVTEGNLVTIPPAYYVETSGCIITNCTFTYAMYLGPSDDDDLASLYVRDWLVRNASAFNGDTSSIFAGSRLIANLSDIDCQGGSVSMARAFSGDLLLSRISYVSFTLHQGNWWAFAQSLEIEDSIVENLNVLYLGGDSISVQGTSFSSVTELRLSPTSQATTYTSSSTINNSTVVECEKFYIRTPTLLMQNSTIKDTDVEATAVMKLHIDSCQFSNSPLVQDLNLGGKSLIQNSELSSDRIIALFESNKYAPYNLTTSPEQYFPTTFYQCVLIGGYVNAFTSVHFRSSTIQDVSGVLATYWNRLEFTDTVVKNCTSCRVVGSKAATADWSYLQVVFMLSTFTGCSTDAQPFFSTPVETTTLLYLVNSTFRENLIGSKGSLFSTSGDRWTMVVNSTLFEDNAGQAGSSLMSLSGVGETSHYEVSYEGNDFSQDGSLLQISGDVDLTWDRGHVHNSTTYAGAIRLNGGGAHTLSKCYFTDNEGYQGGGLQIGGQTKSSLTDCHFSGNNAFDGGAIFARDASVLTLINSTFASNTAANGGGGYCQTHLATVTINNSSFKDNIALTGAAIFVEGSGLSMVNSTVEQNRASYGAGISLSGSSKNEIHQSSLLCNTADEQAGGIAMLSSARLNLLESVVDSNEASIGGGIWISDFGHVTISGGIVSNNKAEFYGGGIFQTMSTHLNVNQGQIFNNTAESGAGVYASTPQLQFEDSTVKANRAEGPGGGMMITSSPGSLISFSNVNFEDNRATSGGAVAVSSSGEMNSNAAPITFDWCYFTSNSALLGGAVYVSEAESIHLGAQGLVQFSHNVAKFGGALNLNTVDSSRPILENVLLMNNSASFAGGSVMVENLGGKAPPDISQLPKFLCSNCTYIDNYSLGYQTEDGWASAPTRLVLSEPSPCGVRYTLDSTLDSLIINTQDAFGNPVQGNILKQVPFMVEASYYGTTTDPMVNMSSLPMDSSSGQVELNPFNFCSKSDSVIRVSIRAVNDSSRALNRMNIQPITDCAFSVGGCSLKGYQPVEDPSNELCEICEEVSRFNWTTFILVMSSLCLCMILLLLVGGLVACKSYQRMRYKIYEAMEIPDVVGNSSTLSLNTVLRNSSVRLLDWEDLTIGEMLGKGAFGIVSRGTHQEEPVAIKELILGIEEHHTEDFTDFLKEIVVMSSLEDKNIVRFVGVAVPPDQSRLCLVTELMQRGSIHDLMDKKGNNLSRNMRFHFAIGAAKGIAHLHKKSLIHRDLKADNLLVDRAWNCKVADFGISTLSMDTDRRRTCIGTPTYMAPEVLMRENYTHKADVFSFGIVLYELFTGKRAYSTDEYASMSVAVLNEAILQGARPDASILGEGIRALVESCWAHNPQDRPTFKEIHSTLEVLSHIN